MRRAKTTFFARLVTAMDRDTVDKILRNQAGVNTTGMSRLDMNYALIAADGNGVRSKSEAIRGAILEYIHNIL